MVNVTTIAIKVGQHLQALLFGLAVCASGCDKTTSTDPPSPSMTVAPAQVNGQAFELRLDFDSNGHEVSRKCVVMVPLPDKGKYKVQEEKPIACPPSLVVTVGTRDDPLGLRDAR